MQNLYWLKKDDNGNYKPLKELPCGVAKAVCLAAAAMTATNDFARAALSKSRNKAIEDAFLPTLDQSLDEAAIVRYERTRSLSDADRSAWLRSYPQETVGRDLRDKQAADAGAAVTVYVEAMTAAAVLAL